MISHYFSECDSMYVSIGQENMALKKNHTTKYDFFVRFDGTISHEIDTINSSFHVISHYFSESDTKQ